PAAVDAAAAAADGGLVDDVVVEEGRRVDELHHRGEHDRPLPAVAAGPAGEEQERGPDALAAALPDVPPDLPHQAQVGPALDPEEVLHPGEVVLDELGDLPQARHATAASFLPGHAPPLLRD